MSDNGNSTLSNEWEIILVHGTWGRFRLPWSGTLLWHEEGSEFRCSLQEEFGEDIAVRSFSWSGRNLFSARRKASELLSEFINQAEFLDKPKKLIIAHSHGGMVTLHALRSPNLAISECRVVTLSTPFLECTIRTFPRVTSISATILLTVAHLALFASITYRFPIITPEMRWYVVGLYALVQIPFAIRIARQLGMDEPNPRIDNPCRDQLLVVRCTNDEASGALALLSFSAWIARRASRMAISLVNTVVEPLSRALFIGVMVSLCGFGLAFFLPMLGFAFMGTLLNLLAKHLPKGMRNEIAETIEMALDFLAGVTQQIVGGIEIFVIHVLVFLTWVGVAVTSAGFGIDLALKCVFLEVSVESTPQGAFSLVHLPATGSGMSHTTVYDHPSLLTNVSGWLERAHSPDAVSTVRRNSRSDPADATMHQNTSSPWKAWIGGLLVFWVTGYCIGRTLAHFQTAQSVPNGAVGDLFQSTSLIEWRGEYWLLEIRQGDQSQDKYFLKVPLLYTESPSNTPVGVSASANANTSVETLSRWYGSPEYDPKVGMPMGLYFSILRSFSLYNLGYSHGDARNGSGRSGFDLESWRDVKALGGSEVLRVLMWRSFNENVVLLSKSLEKGDEEFPFMCRDGIPAKTGGDRYESWSPSIFGKYWKMHPGALDQAIEELAYPTPSGDFQFAPGDLRKIEELIRRGLVEDRGVDRLPTASEFELVKLWQYASLNSVVMSGGRPEGVHVCFIEGAKLQYRKDGGHGK